MSTVDLMLIRGVFSLYTLYMLAILLRWFGPYLELDTDSGKWRFIGGITDPLINTIRGFLPQMGPVDLGPLFTLLFIWLLRQVSVWVLIGATQS